MLGLQHRFLAANSSNTRCDLRSTTLPVRSIGRSRNRLSRRSASERESRTSIFDPSTESGDKIHSCPHRTMREEVPWQVLLMRTGRPRLYWKSGIIGGTIAPATTERLARCSTAESAVAPRGRTDLTCTGSTSRPVQAACCIRPRGRRDHFGRCRERRTNLCRPDGRERLRHPRGTS